MKKKKKEIRRDDSSERRVKRLTRLASRIERMSREVDLERAQSKKLLDLSRNGLKRRTCGQILSRPRQRYFADVLSPLFFETARCNVLAIYHPISPRPNEQSPRCLRGAIFPNCSITCFAKISTAPCKSCRLINKISPRPLFFFFPPFRFLTEPRAHFSRGKFPSSRVSRYLQSVQQCVVTPP